MATSASTLSGISIAYGFSKFISWDRSLTARIPRIFLPADLILAALVMLVMGFVPWATSSIMIMFSAAVPLRLVPGGWAGRRAAGPWCTGGRRKSAAGLSRCGTAHLNVGGGIPPLLFPC